MSGFILRIIAMVTMVTDHVAYYLMDDPEILRMIGRIAFPMYAFLLAEGFIIICKDRKRLLKHLSILIMLVIASEICCDVMEFKLNFSEYMNSQSNMITLLMGFLGMMLTEVLFPMDDKESKKLNKKNLFVLLSGYVLLGFANYRIDANFNCMGPILVIAYYWFIRLSRNHKNNSNNWNWITRFSTLLLIFVIYLPLYFWVRTDFGSVTRLIQEMKDYFPWIIGHILSAFIMSFANGRQGYHKKWFKNLYTVFYPAHALAIGIICIFLGK